MTKNKEKNKDHIPNTPRLKYLQLVDYINELIEIDKLHIGDKLPTLKQLQKELGMSKETLLKGFGHLLEKGIIESVYRKGYYVKKKSLNHNFKVFLLLDKMNLLREKFYQTLFQELNNTAEIDVYFHHHNFKVFENLIIENLANYTHFVITTFLHEDTAAILNLIPPHKRIIIDYEETGLNGEYTCVYQDFGYDIYHGLQKLQEKLSKYKKIILVAPPKAVHAPKVIEGFLLFCQENAYDFAIENKIESEKIENQNVYITFSRYDTDDMTLIKSVRNLNLRLGKDIGLISYNDTAVKEILEDGITTISTNFEDMAKLVACSITKKETIYKRNNTDVFIRASL